MSQPEPKAPPPQDSGGRHRKALFNFGLFGLFFAFYVGAALLQTPLLKEFAVIPALGMPLGLLASLSIFPLSWIILAVWFWRAK